MDEGLKKIRVYLSDVNLHLRSDFEERLKTIGNYLRRLASYPDKYDVKVYNEVQDIFRVHQARVDKLENQSIQRQEQNPVEPYGLRFTLEELKKREAMVGAPLQDERPPVTVEQPADHNLFIQTLRSMTPAGKKLLESENYGMGEVLLNQPSAKEILEEDKSQSQYERFTIRARKRGRQRGAVQLALWSFATNHEQHYEGGWQHNVLRIPPKPLPKRPQSTFTIGVENPIDKGAIPYYFPPYRWTKRYLKFLDLQKIAQISGAAIISLQELARPLKRDKTLPSSEAEALVLIRKQILREAHEDEPSRVLHQTKDWVWVAQESAPGTPKDFFAPGRWPPSSDEGVSTSGKRKAAEAAEEDLGAKRVHLDEQDEDFDDATGSSSSPLPLEQEGVELGHGDLFPQEIRDFDYQRDGHLLENAPDPKERYVPDAARFELAETSFLESAFSHRIEQASTDGMFLPHTITNPPPSTSRAIGAC